MLILKRKLNEELKINTNITVKILSISDNQVKIGIDAPDDVQIYRAELFDKVKKSIQTASKSSVQNLDHLRNYTLNKLKK